MLASTRTSVVYLKRVAAISVAAVGLMVAPQSRAQTNPATVSKAAVSNGDLILGAGNLIEVKVFNAPELDSSLRLSEDGEGNLPLIGSVHFGGLSVDQAQKLVQAKLMGGGFVKDPHVSVMIREFTTQTVSVMGEVQHPGAFPITTSKRLMDAISAAGGFSAHAGHTILINHRDDPTPETVNVSFDAQKLQQSNVELRPGDLITVGKAGLVYVTGEVNKPGGFLLDSGDSVTVLQALALAQGAKPTASLNKARIIRKTPQGPQDVQIALRDITAAKRPDVAMQADDILFIPNSAGKSAGRRSIDSILQVATGVMIYRP